MNLERKIRAAARRLPPLLLPAALWLWAHGAVAQAPDSGAASAATPAPASSAAAAPVPAAPLATRASWLSDRLPFRVGEILTVVVDEQTAASERVSTVATGDRSLGARINAGVSDDDIRLGPEKSFSTGIQSGSRDVGEAGRSGDLTAVLSVRVTAVDAEGIATVQGKKSVNVDGRLQEISLTGLVRPEDVSAARLVRSGRIAEAVITYKGKKIGPRMGIAGKILSILWP